MKQKIIRGLIILAIGFIALFVVRLVYEIVNPSSKTAIQDGTVAIQQNMIAGEFGDFQTTGIGGSKKNYATKIIVNQIATGEILKTEQKYEKVAELTIKSKEFEKDNQTVRSIISNNNAVIQFEKLTGLPGNRYLYLSIGTPPDNFDNVVEKIREIGKLISFRIYKSDKTTEYKNISAEQESLVKMRDALLKLKKMQGNIAERIELEQKILEVERKIQGLGVQLGEFSAENEFCTVRFTLAERMVKWGAVLSAATLISFKWAARNYFLFVVLLFTASLAVLIILKILEKLKWLPGSEKSEK